jgi:hypothetical protein
VSGQKGHFARCHPKFWTAADAGARRGRRRLRTGALGGLGGRTEVDHAASLVVDDQDAGGRVFQERGANHGLYVDQRAVGDDAVFAEGRDGSVHDPL